MGCGRISERPAEIQTVRWIPSKPANSFVESHPPSYVDESMPGNVIAIVPRRVSKLGPRAVERCSYFSLVQRVMAKTFIRLVGRSRG